MSELLTTSKVQLLHLEEETCGTFVIENEDHTIGGLLQWMLLQDQRVEFAGYTVPHPTDHKIHVRIQSIKTPAAVVLNDALTQLQHVMQDLIEKWDVIQ